MTEVFQNEPYRICCAQMGKMITIQKKQERSMAMVGAPFSQDIEFELQIGMSPNPKCSVKNTRCGEYFDPHICGKS